jgi:hypothetical protein
MPFGQLEWGIGWNHKVFALAQLVEKFMADFTVTVISAMLFVLDDENGYLFNAIDFQAFGHQDGAVVDLSHGAWKIGGEGVESLAEEEVSMFSRSRCSC